MRGCGARFWAIAAALVGVLAVALPPSSLAIASSSDEGYLASLTNGARANNGIARLFLSSDLVSIAHRHSADMAASRSIYHDPRLATEVQGWSALGENVGRGGSVSQVHRAFMASAPHRSHILDPTYHELGTGVVRGRDGYVYVTEIFVDRGSVRVTYVTPRHRFHAATRRAAPKPAPRPKPAVSFSRGDQTIGILLQMLALDATDTVQKDIPTGRDPP